MRKSRNSDEYQFVCNWLVSTRKAAGLTQRDLARRLRREPSFVWRIEKGERRLDVVEFHWVCQALRQDAGTVYQQLVRAFNVAVPPVVYPTAQAIRNVADAPRRS